MVHGRHAGRTSRLVRTLVLGAVCCCLLGCPPPNGANGDEPQTDELEVTVYWVFGFKAWESEVMSISGSSECVTIQLDVGDGLGVSIDPVAEKLYWVDRGANAIRRANLDGSNDETLVSGLIDPGYIKLDVATGKMYWTATILVGETETFVGIHRANLDGSSVEPGFVQLDTNIPTGLALRTDEPKTLFWAWKDPGAADYIIQKALVDSPTEHLTMVGGLSETLCMDYGGGIALLWPTAE